jgi:hydrogenase expression/formation protein HypC
MSDVARTSIAEPARNVARTSIAEPAEQATVGRNSCITCGDVALPMRVIALSEDGLADCEDGEGRHSEVEVALLDDVKPGDELLVHACVAIQRVPA